MYLNGWGYGWGGAPMNGLAYLPFEGISRESLDLSVLPEEVREALEARKDEIHSAADLRDMVDEMMLRR